MPTEPPAWPPPAPGTAAIDAHCHLFNVKDLSAVRFISYVVLEQFPEFASGSRFDTVGAKNFAPEDPTFTDRLVALLLLLVGAARAPTAVAELASLVEGKLAATSIDAELDDDALLERVGELLRGRSFGADPEMEDRLRSMLLQAADAPLLIARPPDQLPPLQAKRLAGRALAGSALSPNAAPLIGSDRDLGSLFQFIKQLRRSRTELVDALTQLHVRDGVTPQLLAPAMVDFGRWLRNDPEEGSSFAQQVALWQRISRRPTGPAVHGYIAFCPLRQVLFDRGAFGPSGRIATVCSDDPLALVRSALTDGGFLGVKLYPPMGFRAWGNVGRAEEGPGFPQAILEDVFGKGDVTPVALRTAELGRLLDTALDRVYTLCSSLGAPIIAHAANSIAANCDYGALADPFFWQDVFERPGAPAIMLAHFGSFSDVSADPRGGRALASAARCEQRLAAVDFDSSWEASIGRYVHTNPAKPVFADISMFVEVLDTAAQAPILARFRRLKHDFPAMTEHLVFGTDWTMLAQDRRAARYDSSVRGFLAQVFTPDEIEGIMRLNFLRYAGLANHGPGFRRVSRVYDGQPALLARLAQACAT